MALAVASGVYVSVFQSSLIAGNGGNGAPGGLGAPGGPGSVGEPLPVQSDTGSCGAPTMCAVLTTTLFAPAGGKGGDGGHGSNGGSGAGGPSYAVLMLGSGLANLSVGTTLSFGASGIGAPGATNGGADAVVTLP